MGPPKAGQLTRTIGTFFRLSLYRCADKPHTPPFSPGCCVTAGGKLPDAVGFGSDGQGQLYGHLMGSGVLSDHARGDSGGSFGLFSSSALYFYGITIQSLLGFYSIDATFMCYLLKKIRYAFRQKEVHKHL
jgi:hypothetical protein